jgi:hypothetical protein
MQMQPVRGAEQRDFSRARRDAVVGVGEKLVHFKKEFSFFEANRALISIFNASTKSWNVSIAWSKTLAETKPFLWHRERLRIHFRRPSLHWTRQCLKLIGIFFMNASYKVFVTC